MARFRTLRVIVIVMLSLLVIQFELGMNVNLSPDLKEIPPVALSFPAVWGALSAVGGSSIVHAFLGTFLVLAGLLVLVLSVLSKSTSIAVMGTLCFATTAVAAICGVLFTVSGFKDDGLSHGMATNFIVSFALHFVLLSILFVKMRRPAGT
jgi:hypothetical protein